MDKINKCGNSISYFDVGAYDPKIYKNKWNSPLENKENETKPYADPDIILEDS